MCGSDIFSETDFLRNSGQKEMEVFMAFVDLEKAYDRVDRDALWKVMGGKLV